jgi:hypothetical protein
MYFYVHDDKTKLLNLLLHLAFHIYVTIYYIYPCCSHLEHRASAKRSVSLQFVNIRQSVGLLRRGISPKQGRYLLRTTERQNKRRQTFMP